MKDIKDFFKFMYDLGWIYVLIAVICIGVTTGVWALQAWIVKSVFGW